MVAAILPPPSLGVYALSGYGFGVVFYFLVAYLKANDLGWLVQPLDKMRDGIVETYS